MVLSTSEKGLIISEILRKSKERKGGLDLHVNNASKETRKDEAAPIDYEDYKQNVALGVDQSIPYDPYPNYPPSSAIVARTKKLTKLGKEGYFGPPYPTAPDNVPLHTGSVYGERAGYNPSNVGGEGVSDPSGSTVGGKKKKKAGQLKQDMIPNKGEHRGLDLGEIGAYNLQPSAGKQPKKKKKMTEEQKKKAGKNLSHWRDFYNKLNKKKYMSKMEDKMRAGSLIFEIKRDIEDVGEPVDDEKLMKAVGKFLKELGGAYEHPVYTVDDIKQMADNFRKNLLLQGVQVPPKSRKVFKARKKKQ